MVEAYRPKTLDEACRIRAEKGAVPFAGGTDLMVKYRYESGVVPDFGRPVLFLDKIEEIHCVEREGDLLLIGGGATLTQVLNHPETPDILRKAVRSIAAPGLRNTATLAGNLCNASPAGDSILALYALDAQVELARGETERTLPIEEFITGPGKTVLREDELVAAVAVPLKPPAGDNWMLDKGSDGSYSSGETPAEVSFFRKVGTRKANALTKVSLAGRARFSGKDTFGKNTSGKDAQKGADAVVDEIAIAFGAVAPTVVRSREIEERIKGKSLGEIGGEKEELISAYDSLVRPIDDQRSTALYRKKVAMNLLRSFFEDHLLKEL
ncbi:MAG: FAD binding domain-containing protein [Spirochaetaceae bacterium]